MLSFSQLLHNPVAPELQTWPNFPVKSRMHQSIMFYDKLPIIFGQFLFKSRVITLNTKESNNRDRESRESCVFLRCFTWLLCDFLDNLSLCTGIFLRVATSLILCLIRLPLFLIKFCVKIWNNLLRNIRKTKYIRRRQIYSTVVVQTSTRKSAQVGKKTIWLCVKCEINFLISNISLSNN